MRLLKIITLGACIVGTVVIVHFTISAVGNGVLERLKSDNIDSKIEKKQSVLHMLELRYARVQVRLYHNPDNEKLKEEKLQLKKEIINLQYIR